MRPVVNRAQRLAPGMPRMINPETAWGVWMLNSIMFILSWSGIINLLVRFIGPPANPVAVEDYGFREIADYIETA